MLKKIIAGIVVTSLLAAAENLAAQEAPGEGGTGQVRQRRVSPQDAGRGARSGRGRPTRERFDQWLNELTEAYQQQDREKMGRLIEDMKQRRGSRPDARGGPGPEPRDRDRDMSPADNSPIPKEDAEKKVLGVLEDMDRNQRRGMMNVPLEDGRLLRLLAETMGAKRVVEVGTSNGYSAIWFCLGLRKTGGKLITHEINAERAELARKNFKRAGVEDIVTLVEGDAHEKVKDLKGPVDIVFLDADKGGYADYLNKLLPLVRPGGLILAHNTTGSGSGMQDYIKAVTTSPDLDTVFVNRQDRGIGATLKKR
ncbi:MAG TPA: O-methyltransferase [Sedimentisphaerales bacterium]|nr:O-methyltransferase [Sedimentisphaerales bacterium]